MNLNLKPYLVIAGTIILTFILIGIWRNAVPAKNPEQWDRQYGNLLKPIVFGLFFVFGLMMVPVFLKLFITLQAHTGRGITPKVQWIKSNANGIVYTVWTVFTIGLFAALPFMIKDGFFKNDPVPQNTYKVN